MRIVITLIFLTASRLFSQTYKVMILKIVEGKTNSAFGQCIIVHFRNDTMRSMIQTDENGKIALGFLKPLKASDEHDFRVIAQGFVSQDFKVNAATKFPLTVRMTRSKSLRDINFEPSRCNVIPTIKDADKIRDNISLDE